VRPGNLKAIGTMLAGVAFFSVLDAGLKRLSSVYPPIEVMFVRAAASLPFLAASVAWTGAWRELRVHRPVLYLMRAALGIAVLWTFIYAVSVQSLSYTYAIYMSAPLMVAALAGPMLGERVPLQRWVAIAVGLAGVIIALKPSGGFVALGGLAAAFSAGCYAFNVMAVRLIGRTDSNYAVVFWHLTLVMLASAAIGFRSWQPIAVEYWPWIAVCGLTGALGQYLFTAAFRLAPASTIAPFEYTALLWGVGLDWLVFSTIPHLRVLLGGAIVIAAGLYVILDEHRAGQDPLAEMPPLA
jgi:drug/metabolite transporter (DMT)-like permease